MVSTEILNCRSRGLLTPEGRPYGRTMSELGEISNEETTVVRLLASDTDTVGSKRGWVQFPTGDEWS